MKNLPTDALRAFVTVAEVGGFTQAGKILGRSQPAVSLQIKRLEEMLGQTLFFRSDGGVEPTEAGFVLLEQAKRLLAINDEIAANTTVAPLEGSITLGIPSEFAVALLPKIVSRFCRTYPKVTLQVVSDLSCNLIECYHQGQYDIVLALHEDPSDAAQQLVTTEELVWVGSKHQTFVAGQVLPLIAAPEGCIYRKRAITKLQEASLPWQLVFTFPDLTGIKTVLEEGLGVTVLAKSTVPSGLKILKPSQHLPALGKIGVSLYTQTESESEATERLSQFLLAGLSLN